MDNAEEFPLDVHLGFSSQGEPFQLYRISNIAEHRLDNSHAPAIKKTPPL
jgi:hypothetical protein